MSLEAVCRVRARDEARLDVRDERDKNATRIADLKRVDEIIKRSTALWIGLLGALVFASVTLAGVKDIAFFNPKMGTQLPFTGVAVPVVYFFYGGSLLIAVVYIYLHIYLEQLWDILGKAPALVDGRTLSERLHPWLVADFALRWRDRLRKTPRDQRAAQRRALSSIADFAAVVLVWLFTPAVLVWFWWRSMPAHDPWMTGLIGACLLATIYVGVGAYASARVSLNRAEEILRNPRRPARWVFGLALPVVAVLTVLRAGVDPPQRVVLGDDGKPVITGGVTRYEPQSWDDYIVSAFCPWTSHAPGPASTKTGQINSAPLFRLEPPEFCKQLPQKNDPKFSREYYQELHKRKVLPNWLLLASADLAGMVFSEKPKDWLGLEFAKAEFKAKWCRDRSPDPKSTCPSALVPDDTGGFDEKQIKAFDQDWSKRRIALLGGFTKINLEKADLRRANLNNASFEGIDLREARLEGADLSGARLEGAQFSDAHLEGALLRESYLEGADLSRSRLEGADLSEARLEGAGLSEARLEGAQLNRARLEGADLSFARLEGVNLSSARLEGADLGRAHLDGVILSEAHLKGVNLGFARLDGADLSFARLDGADLRNASLKGADMSFALLFKTKVSVTRFFNTRFEATRVDYTAFRSVDMRYPQLDGFVGFDSTFGDGTVDLETSVSRPCQWLDIKLSDEEFFGRWKGWLEANDDGTLNILDFLFLDLDDYKAIPPPTYCVLPQYRRDRPPPPSLPSTSP